MKNNLNLTALIRANPEAGGKESRMRRGTILFIAILASLVFGLPKEAQAQLHPNITLHGAHLFWVETVWNKQSVEKDVSVELEDQEYVVGFNPAIGNPDLMSTLDLSNPLIPLINNPSTGLAFSIFWGMYPPDPGRPSIQFNLPMDATGGLIQPVQGSDPNSFTYDFGANDGTNFFDIHFVITGSTPLDPLSWGMSAPPDPVLPAVQFNFSFQSPGNPTLAFSVMESGQQLIFAPVPEPETYALLLAGLGLLGFHARRRKLKETAAS